MAFMHEFDGQFALRKRMHKQRVLLYEIFIDVSLCGAMTCT
jgi:hypothetical protein